MINSGLLLLVINLLVLLFSFYNSKKGKSFSETPLLWPLGIFVWGDGLVVAPFWIFVLVFSLIFHQWKLFFVIVSIFWLVRSLGEVIYWFNQQFSTIERNKPANMLCYTVVKNESIWFLYQLFWQCLVVISVVAAIYTTTIWVRTV